MQGVDEGIVLFFQNIRCDILTTFFKFFIPLEIWYGIALVLVLFFFLQTRVLRLPLISFFIARNLSIYCYDVAKDFFHRPRPFLAIKGAVPLVTPHGFSFPSGHATLAMASAVVLAHHFPKARRLVFLLAILIGLSRVYLGVHYLSDVLGGYILGAFLGCLSIYLERGIISLTEGMKFFQKKAPVVFLVGAMFLFSTVSHAKGGDEQDQIILLNDSAAALEDSNPQLSKSLTQFADEKEKEWEDSKNNKDGSLGVASDKNKAHMQEQIKLLKAAALAIGPMYPLIAKALNQMIKDINKPIEIQK